METLSKQNQEKLSPGEAQRLTDKFQALRQKLLNLTLRNKLLNFRHNERTKGFVRIVDELPNTLYKQLCEGWMQLLPLPDMPREEDSPEFTRALEELRLTDADYRAQIDQQSDDNPDSADKLELLLRQKTRVKLGLPPSGRLQKSLADHAREHGINPSFELPRNPPTGSEEKWIDDRIQLLLTPELADRRLSQLIDMAGEHQKEQGVNTLFGAFGFLQWKEDDNSTNLITAPLLMMPVQIRREVVKHQYAYQVSADGADPEVNSTLKERLRRDFGIHMPDLEEGDTPEIYWAKVHALVETRRDWKVVRWITLGIFPFAKMSMYMDLDPAHWPDPSKLVQHTVLQDILLGKDHEPGDSAGTASFDEYAGDAPLLVTDCDSSQLKSIKRCLGNQSAVIQGPPGTGKSQTITNLIAAALAQGETVLFVAEKLAALKVVASRLNHSGLEPFLLELHSDKVLKEGVMHSLKLRLETQKPALDERKLRDHLRLLSETRDELNRYAELLNRTFGLTELTVHQILWSYMNLRRVHADVPESLQNHPLEHRDRWGVEARAQSHSWASQASRSAQELKNSGHCLQLHPWRGITPQLRGPLQLSKIKDWLDQLLLSLRKQNTDFTALQKVFEMPDREPLANLRRVLLAIGRLGLPPAGLTQLKSASINQPEELIECRLLLTSLQQLSNSPEWVKNNHHRQELCQALPSLVSGLTGFLVHLPDQQKESERLRKKLIDLLGLGSELSHLSSELSELKGQHLPSLRMAAGLAAGLSQEALKSRSQMKFDQPLGRLLQEARALADELGQRENRLEQLYTLSADPDLSEFEGAEKELRSAGFFSFLSGSYRRAKRFYKGLAKSTTSQKDIDKANALRELRKYYLDQQAFREHADYKQAFGALHRGRQSPFDLIGELCQLETSVGQSLSGISPLARDLRRQLLEGDSSLVEFLANLHREQVLEIPWQSETPPVGPLREEGAPVQARIDQLKNLQELVAQFESLPQELEVQALASLGQQIQQYLEARRAVADSSWTERLFSQPISSDYREISHLKESLDYLEKVPAEHFRSGLFPFLVGPGGAANFEKLSERTQQLVTSLEKTTETWETFCRDELMGSDSFFDSRPWREHALAELLNRFEHCSEAHTLLSDYCQLTESLDRLGKAGFAKLVEQCKEDETWLMRLPDLVDLIIAHNLADAVHQLEDNLLSRHRGLVHEELQNRFRQLDLDILQVNCQLLQSRLLDRAIPEGVGRGKAGDKTDKALIQAETAKSRRHVPLRDLIARASGAIQALKPCLMMSPLSVSQYLPPGKMEFDLLIIDEASQMTPEDAVGAIARCKRIVVVGDPKQLPPTNFFSKRFDDNALDEDDDAVDSESVLDLSLGVYHPAVDLRWHYRSRLASLIAFSNRNFYDGRLQIFPSPQETSPDFGVKLHRVQGAYHKGLNPLEAEAIIEHSLRLMAQFPDRSQGLVALNQAQRDYIYELLEKRIAESDLATEYTARWQQTLEPYFVKNLENVQGDERDFILISTVYGPDEKGAMAQRFGPINQSQGHRRLNVLFTRAKYSTQIFSSMGPEHIKPSENSSRGVIALKDFLSFAETGRMQDAHPTGKPPDSDFEIMVAEDLKAHGFEVKAQVGAGGYFVDLGINHPNYPHGFLAGIECDGASYHSGKLARDRDRLRQQVLESLGWTILRIWSTDYFRDRDRTMARVVESLNDLLARSG